jgi:hypothetical protein
VKERIWKFIAAFVVSRPRLVNWLIGYAMRKPYFHLPGYMGRWWLMPNWTLSKDEYGNRFPKTWMPFSIRIHHIKRPDDGRDLHDHPFDYRTIILKGWYDECDIFGRSNIRSAGETVSARAQTFHRISAMPAAGVWTLFIMGPRINSWGFLVGGRKIYYKHYLKLED